MPLKVGTRYSLVEKARFRKGIIAYKQANPDATLREIGRVFRVSHTRVWAILKKHGNVG